MTSPAQHDGQDAAESGVVYAANCSSVLAGEGYPFACFGPSCSVRLGNVQFQSGNGPGDWNRIRSWGLYARGLSTNLSVTGPTLLAELELTDGRIDLQGSASFDMGVFANTVRLYRTAQLHVSNAALGEFGIPTFTVGMIEANDSAQAVIQDVRTGPLRLRTTNAAAAITAANVFGVGNLILDSAAGGTIHVQQATPAQATDLQNLGFESTPLSSGVPPYWQGSGLTGALVASPAPGAPGSLAYQAGFSAGASLSKSPTLPPGTFLDVLGAVAMVAPPASLTMALQVSQGAAVVASAVDPTLSGWRKLHLPTFTVPALGPTQVQWSATGGSAVVQIDDVRVQIGNWWDADNLANLDFEMGCRYQGVAPTYWAAPDAWYCTQMQCEPDGGAVRPGAALGSRSVRGSAVGSSANLWKNLTFLRPGETVVVTGFARGIASNPNARLQVIVGNGANFFQVAPPNVFSTPMLCDGVWRSFSLTYVVPANPSYTRINLALNNGDGGQCWFDDLTVEVR